MKKTNLRRLVIPTLVVLSIAVSSAHARAEEPRRPPIALDKAYNVTLGQMIALTATTILQTLKPVDAPMMAIFNGQKIEIWVLGVRSTTRGARETLETFQTAGWPTMVAMIQSLYGVKLTEREVTVIYRNRRADDKEVIRRENGQYLAK